MPVHSDLGLIDIRAHGAVGGGIVDDYAAISSAFAAAAATGGAVIFPPGTYRTSGTITYSTNKRLMVSGYGATLKLDAGSSGLKLNQGPSNIAGVSVLGLTVDGQSNASTTGIVIDDQYGATLRDVTIKDCTIGLHIKDTTSWSEGTDFDGIYVTGCATGIKFEKTGGTGSFGYCNWGLVHIDNVPSSGKGVHWAAGSAFHHANVDELVVHVSAGATGAVALDIDGDFQNNVQLHGVLEGSGALGSRNGIEIDASANVLGVTFFIYFAGTWTNEIVNPGNLEYRLSNRGRDFFARATGSDITRHFVHGDSQPRLSLRPGRILFGDGSSSVDANFSRSAAGRILVEDQLAINNVGAGADPYFFSNSGGSSLDLVSDAFRPSVDGATDLGTISRRFGLVFGNSFRVNGAAGDANPVVQLSASGLQLGAGGASAVDLRLFRGAVDRLDLESGDSFNIASGSILGTYSLAGTPTWAAAPTVSIGSDATGDIYYRASGGLLTRLGIGSAGQVLSVSGGLPAWATTGGSAWTDAGAYIHPTTLSDHLAIGTSTSTIADNAMAVIYNNGMVAQGSNDAIALEVRGNITFNGGPGANAHSAVFLAPAFDAASGGQTLTNAATLYIDGAPTGSANLTITNAYAAKIDGSVWLGSSAGKVGFFGSSGTTRQSITNLTDNSGGTANDTLQNVGVVYTQAEVANNFADLAAKLNAVIDALQAYNLLG